MKIKSTSVYLLSLALLAMASCNGNKKHSATAMDAPDILTEQKTASTIIRKKNNRTEAIDSSKASINEKNTTPQTINLVLEPIRRSRYEGIEISPALLEIRTEYDYYPISTKEIKLIIVNKSNKEYTCGDSYSIEYHDEEKGAWEPLPVNPISEDMLWIISQRYNSRLQTIRLYTDVAPNRPGKYRIHKPFNDYKEVAVAEFEMVDQKGIDKQLMDSISRYFRRKDANDTIIENWNTIHTELDDSIYVKLKNNTMPYREMFRKEVLNYSALNFGIDKQPQPLEAHTVPDTMGISMRTEKAVYPIGTGSVKVIIHNNNNKELFFGLDYGIARKDGNKWIPLNTNNVWNSVGIGISKGKEHSFYASLDNLVNDNKPGTYKVFKKLGFDGSREEWYMSAEFRLE